MGTVDAERIARLERQVELLLGRVEHLESENARLAALETENAELRRRLGENSSNSSKPPSSDSPADRSARPKAPPSSNPRGAQLGHKGHKRTFLPPTSSSDCFPSECRRCGTKLPKRRDPDALRHQVLDVPKIEPTADDYWLHRVTCSCGETTCGTLPDGVPEGMLGSQVLALIAVLTADGHMSRRKVRALLRDVFGLEVSLGTLSESEQIVSDAVAPAVEEARLHALTEKVKHVDATTWYQGGAYRSLWTLATATVTVFTIAADGTRATLRKWIDRVRGVLVSDRGPQFDFWAMERRQRKSKSGCADFSQSKSGRYSMRPRLRATMSMRRSTTRQLLIVFGDSVRAVSRFFSSTRVIVFFESASLRSSITAYVILSSVRLPISGNR